MIEVRKLVKHYNTVRAVEGIDFTITHGERDRSSTVNNQDYDDDLTEWVADYTAAILAMTGQYERPVFLVDQLRTEPVSGVGHKIQMDQFKVRFRRLVCEKGKIG